jgi:hypothetical protein
MMIRLLSVATLSLVTCIACAKEPPTKKERPPVREYELGQPAGEVSTQHDPLPATVMEAIQADAVKRAAVTADQITVLSSEQVTWSNGALGCPQPGRMYTQALVPGFRVAVRAGKQMILYHAAESGALVVCPRGARRDPASETVAQ